MNIAQISLPFYLKPSLLNLSKRARSNQLIVFSDDNYIQEVEYNVFKGDLKISNTINCNYYEISEDGNVQVFLFPKKASIQYRDKIREAHFVSEVSKVSVFPFTSDSYYVFLYGSNIVETYFVSENHFSTIPPIQLPNKCNLLSYSHGVLFTALSDSSLVYLVLGQDQLWKQLGSEIFNTYRITDINCSNFPQVVLTTWEGHIFIEHFELDPTQTGLKSVKFIESYIPEESLGEYCGSFVQYNRENNVYIVSLAIRNELVVYNHDWSALLLKIRLPTFLRGLVVSKEDSIPLVIGLTNHAMVAFYLPSVSYLQNTPILLNTSEDLIVTRTLSWLVPQFPTTLSTPTTQYSVLNHCIRAEDAEKQTIYFSKRIVNTTLITSQIGVFDLIHKQMIHSFHLAFQTILSILFLEKQRFDLAVVVTCVEDDLKVASYKADIEFGEYNDTLSVKKSPSFTRMEIMNNLENRPLSINELYSSL